MYFKGHFAIMIDDRSNNENSNFSSNNMCNSLPSNLVCCTKRKTACWKRKEEFMWHRWTGKIFYIFMHLYLNKINIRFMDRNALPFLNLITFLCEKNDNLKIFVWYCFLSFNILRLNNSIITKKIAPEWM